MDKLIDKIEAGAREIYPSDFPSLFKGVPRAIAAFNGSINDALILAEMRLQNWGYQISGPDYPNILLTCGEKVYRISGFHPARGLLVAILKAINDA